VKQHPPREQNHEDSHQNAVTEENPVIETMIQSEIRAKPNCANRNARPPRVPGDPVKSFIRTAGGPATGTGGAMPTGCTVG